MKEGEKRFKTKTKKKDKKNSSRQNNPKKNMTAAMHLAHWNATEWTANMQEVLDVPPVDEVALEGIDPLCIVPSSSYHTPYIEQGVPKVGGQVTSASKLNLEDH